MQENRIDVRFAVVAPTYNNAGTLRNVIDQLLTLELPLFIVNDGSTDQTSSLLLDMAGDIQVVTHARNLGKAAAIKTGFAAAIQAGCTHVITIDTDGQHDVSDVPKLIAIARSHQEALIIGERDDRDVHYPRSSLSGRKWSNRFVKLESGLVVSDSQSGLRIYPRSVMSLPVSASRYGFETEVLTRAGWANVQVIETPIRCIYEVSTGRVSHFRPWRDTISAFAMHARLLLRSMLPISPVRINPIVDSTMTGTIFQRTVRWFSPMKAWRAIRTNEEERKRFAAAIAVGIFIANLPIYGCQTVLSLIAARRLRLHPLAVIAGSHLSTPPFNAFLVCLAVIVGHWILNGQLIHWHDIYPPPDGYFDLIQHMASAVILGSIVCGIGLGLLAYLVLQLLLFFVPLRKPDVESSSSDYVAEA